MIFIWSRQFPVQRWPPNVNIINGCGRYVVLIEGWLFYAKDFPRMRLKWFCQGKRGGIVDVYLTIRVTNNNLLDFKDYIFYNVFNLENIPNHILIVLADNEAFNENGDDFDALFFAGISLKQWSK